MTDVNTQLFDSDDVFGLIYIGGVEDLSGISIDVTRNDCNAVYVVL